MSRIITFYSYKGGVGRTVALANIGVLLARRGKRVLLIDCDLEAPGLDCYFRPYVAHPQPTEHGMIHLLHDAAQSSFAEWGSHRMKVALPPVSNADSERVNLDLIGSGSAAADYADLVRSFSWQKFFEQQSGGVVLERWRDEWKSAYDFVLIDSRTGITDAGGVCTILLPDFLALVFSANDQSFEGALAIVRAAQNARRSLGVPRPPLTILPIPSRFDRGDEVAEADHWLRRFSEELKPFYNDWLPKRFKPLQILELTKIPYVTLFSFGEKLPVLTHGTSEPQLPGYYYRNLARLLESDFRDAASIIDPQSVAATRKLFISHSSRDDAFVRDLCAALADDGQEPWFDSRELRGGDPLWLEIQYAIEEASAYAIVVGPDALQSKWFEKELRHALDVKKQRGEGEFPIIPLSLNGTKLGVLEEIFGEEPVYIPVSNEAGGVEAAMNAILLATGKRLPADVPAIARLDELVLELTDLKFHEQDGFRRASARARLVYEPATPGQPDVQSAQSWRLVAPIGTIEAGELRWYLEKYAIWPSEYFRDRARKVEESLVKWGRLLHEAAMPVAHRENVMKAWANTGDHPGRRFSVHVDAALESGAPDAEVAAARETATLLLGLPWELLHNGNGFLFQGSRPTSVRRRLPNTRVLQMPVMGTPIRILLATPRPEDEACAYIDHRASALPLVEAMESLPGLVKIHVLSPPTLAALRDELDRARDEKRPYHVVHFDGHGLYDRTVGLGGLCFEHPEDIGRLERRRHVTVFTSELDPLLRDHRIPLVFLEACQTAQAEKASESVASELLKVGVASVLVMSHSVLVETARRFVEAFYRALAGGKRVGDAMLAGQRQLKDDTFRGTIFGAGELRLEDWFVPVLYQEKDDPQLFKITPAKQTLEDFRTALAVRLGELPPVPETGFIGRSRELLALQRLLRQERYAVVRGQSGEGKTALAAEFARWMVRSQQMRRAAFVSVETHGNQRAVVDALGKQLVRKEFSAAGDLNDAIKEIERALREQPALLVVDNMESVLLPPFMEEETPDAVSQEAREELQAILALCERLLKAGDTRVIFTSDEALPSPFDSERHRRELHQLDREDAVKLVERVLNAAGGDPGASSDAAREEIEQLVDAVHCHARTLALLAPALRSGGVDATRTSLVELMGEMEKKFPGSREKSVFASVELSLRRLSESNRDKAQVLGVFQGGVDLDVLRTMMKWEEADVASLAVELVETGLATPNRYNHLTLNPALCPYLRERMKAAERKALTARWVAAMGVYVGFLVQQTSQKAEVAATLTVLELPNLFALLNLVQRAGDAEATIDLASSLYSLLQRLGKPRLLERVGQARDAAAAALGDDWNHSRFQAARTLIEQQLDGGGLRQASDVAHQLLQRARAAGGQAYPGADYDLAVACFILGRALKIVGESEHALVLLEEAQQRFEDLAR